ncbi:hypothetical protein AWB76_00923 [Caballeronia temeraria]|uniref:Uncharacterized protein n=1 Tax=Caballeronia temeraria TaxID=1777137 RepID=A0A157ZM03_9BURK|nr:hypothetical protein [Caballeronia temeraria]SAK46489.1 hypothetical protein AWB76_00923 [Caballeronia temeraria]
MTNDYPKLLEDSYAMYTDLCEVRGGEPSKFAFLGDHLFDFTTYDDEVSALFANVALQVCKVITRKTTFKFIEDESNYQQYLLMCNTTFFAGRLDWGGSIRGAWWNQDGQELDTCGFFVGRQQVCSWTFTEEQWKDFMEAVFAFAASQGEGQ